MKRAILVALGTGTFITSAAAIGIGFGGPSARMDRAQYEDALRGAGLALEGTLVHCQGLGGTERELCRAEANAHATINVADIENEFRRTQQSARAAQRARIDARYQLDRAHCQALSGYKREKCVVKAHAEKGRALLEAAAPYEARF